MCHLTIHEYDDVRVVLVKLALDGHFHAVRYYLDNAGCFNGFGSKADYSDGKDEGNEWLPTLLTKTLPEKIV
jgi:hypothetical protein